MNAFRTKKPNLIEVKKPYYGWRDLPKNIKYYMNETDGIAYDYLGYLDLTSTNTGIYNSLNAVHIFGRTDRGDEHSCNKAAFYTIEEDKDDGGICNIPYIESPAPTTGGKKSNRRKSKRSNKTRKIIK